MASSCRVIFLVIADGAIGSTTVTMAVAEAVLPELSVPVRVTVFSPSSEQSKLSLSSDSVSDQLSDDPLSISATVMVA